MTKGGSTTGYTMTLANSIIGVGILAMPFCFQKCGILLSIILLIMSNFMTRLTSYYLLKTSVHTRRRSFDSIALHIFGSSGKLLVGLGIIGYLFGSCVTYYVVVGDLGPQIISRLFDISISDSLRTLVMIAVTIFCIIPLSLLRNMESLAHVSTTSIIFYLCLVLKIAFDSEEKITSTYWIDNIYWWRPSGVLQCLPIFCMSLSCQTQIFEVYESLPNQSLEKMNRIVKSATNICTGVYILVGIFGYVAYSGQPFSGNILLSFTPSLASEIIKLGFVLSVAFSFPLVIFPCRASLYSVIYHRSHSELSHYIPEHRFQYITISIVLAALIIGILIPSMELVIGLVGSTIGVAICLIFPASCFIKTNKKNSTEKLLAQFLLVFAFVLMILGTFANLEAIDSNHSSIHEDLALNPVVDSLPIVDKLPHSIDDNVDKPSVLAGGVGNAKMRIIPPFKPIEQIAAPINNSVREVNLFEAKAPPPLFGPKEEPKPNQFRPNEVKAAKDVNPVNIEKIVGTNTAAESTINKDAIQKEEQEIAIDAKEDKQKNLENAKEILNEVKNELAKQNEESQKIVLDKILKISEKVNEIEKLHEVETPMKKDELLAPVPVAPVPDEKPVIIKNKEVATNIRGDAKANESTVVNDPIIHAMLPIQNTEQKSKVDPPPAELTGKIGRNLLGFETSVLNSRTKRDTINYEYKSKSVDDTDEQAQAQAEADAQQQREYDKMEKNAIRIKNTINPKYSQSRIEYLRNAFKARREVLGKSEIRDHDEIIKSRKPELYHSFDDSRFEKYIGFDDSDVFFHRNDVDVADATNVNDDNDSDTL